MRATLFSTALIATVAAQGVIDTIPPPGSPPGGCQASADGRWELSVEALAPPATIAPIAPVPAVPVAPVPVAPVPVSPSSVAPSSSVSVPPPSAASVVPVGTVPGMPLAPVVKRAEPVKNTLLVSLTNGVLKDRYNRVGYIAANRQFQFDGPPQAGALFTGGWTMCNNGTLALGPSAMFYRCRSGDFYNLYDQRWATHCSPIFIHATKASTEVVNEVPPLASGAPPPPPPGPTPASSSSATVKSSSASSATSAAATTPAIVVPPASTTITTKSSTASGAASSASSLSSAATSLLSSASSLSLSAVQAGSTGIPSARPPVEPSQAGAGNMNQLSTAAGLSMAAVLAAFALLM